MRSFKYSLVVNYKCVYAELVRIKKGRSNEEAAFQYRCYFLLLCICQCASSRVIIELSDDNQLK